MPEISLQKIERDVVVIKIAGTAPLITHRWSEKAKEMMLRGQQGKRSQKVAKDPLQDYESSLYQLGDGYGFPVTAFKAATIDAARYFNGIAMTQLRRGLFFAGEGPDQLVRINGTPEPREDMVRVGMGTADIRYRAMFPEWSAELNITYVSGLLDMESVLALVDAGGLGGVGEWRPGKSSTGSFGTYGVVEGAQAAVITRRKSA